MLHHRTRVWLTLAAAAVLFAAPPAARAIPAITCHCFTERSYDPARPTAADPYFLATTQNTLLALVFNADKTSIVLKKQQGASGDDLWVAYWIAAKAGVAAEELLQAKTDKVSWRDLLAARRIAPKRLGGRVADALQANAMASRLAVLVVDDLFRSYRLLEEGELAALRKGGATNQELIVAALVARKTQRPATQVYRDAKSGGQSWGGLLQQARIDPRQMQRELSDLLKSGAR